MVVMKFGGSSVASAENIREVKNIILDKADTQQVIVVVSALGGITSQLITCSGYAQKSDEAYLQLFKEIEDRHIALVKSLIGAQKQSAVLGQVKILMNELEDILRGVFLIGELSQKTSDRVLMYGEQLSSTIIAAFLQSSGADVQLVNPRELILTDNTFGRANVMFKETTENIRGYFRNTSGLFICPGFIAANEHQEVTTLGRGGSDYTAAIFAAALEAPKLEIWTDVDGMMTADPRLVKSAYAIAHISYDEAMELSHFGAKVIYPPTIQPVLEKNIPIHIKNTFNKVAEGTIIGAEQQKNGKIIKGISCIEQVALLNLSGTGMVGIPNFSHRLFRALSSDKVNVIMITQASSEHSICVGIDEEDVPMARKAVNEEFKFEMGLKQVNELEIETNLSIIALVGSNMKQQVGVSGQMFNTLGQNGVNVKAIAQGSSEKNISAIIRSDDVKKALNTLHESFFLSERKVINLFIIGVGNVGRALINQLKAQQGYLLDRHHVDLRVIALANSRKMAFQEKGLDLTAWEQHLKLQGETMDLDDFLNKMKHLNLRNSIFIDNTANEEVALKYQSVLKNSVSVVTPNKIACTRSMEEYELLKKTALKYKSRFLYETNVGAGLPVINTLSDLVKSGDEVLKIEAVLSGSLNFIFNHYTGEAPFVEIVKQAQQEGYTEPDPRIDLSGIDVMRKILILIRDSGVPMEIEDIKSEPFVPQKCMNAASVEAFFESLEKEEEIFRKLIRKAREKGCKLKYVATYDQGQAHAGLKMVEPQHPFYNLEGKDNIVLFTTRRYPDQPLVIKGAGAGADVTASGIFADIMRITNS